MKLLNSLCLFFSLTVLTTTLLFAQANLQPGTAVVSSNRPPDASVQAKAKVLDGYGKLPLAFEANRGQTDERVRFLSRGQGYTVFLTDSEAVMTLRGGSLHPASPRGKTDRNRDKDADAGDRAGSSVLRMKIQGASPNPKVSALDELEGRSNYFIGNDPKKWTSDIPLYKKVRFQSVYPGIDLLYYGTQGQLEYDFVVAPHADPHAIKLTFDGARRMAIDKDGDLQINADTGQVTFHKPVISQYKDGVGTPVGGRFRITKGNEVSFELGRYDRSRELVIDPSLVYATYLSGSSNDYAGGIAVDSSGNAYVTGYTTSPDFPTTSGAYRTASAGVQNVFITKLNATGSALVYSTYLGGSQYDYGYWIALDSNQNAYVTGYTTSPDFPTTVGAFQQCSSGSNTFITKLSGTGSALAYSTCLGANVSPSSIGVDGSGSAYIAGSTGGSIPVTPGAFQIASAGSVDAFVMKLSPDGTGLAYSTYLGGRGNDYAESIAVDSDGHAYVAGYTSSTNFPTTASAFRSSYQGGGYDAFVTELTADGAALVYSTYLGGAGSDAILGVAVDKNGSAYVWGETSSLNFPVTPGAYITQYSSGQFATKFTSDGSGIIYSTYLDPFSANPNSIAVDSSGDLYVIPVVLSSDGSTLLGTYSNGYAYPMEIAVDTAGSVYLALSCAYESGGYCDGFKATPGAFQTVPPKTVEDTVAATVSKFSPLSSPVVNISITSINFGSQIVNSASSTISATLTNEGESPLAITSITASGDYSETNNCGNSLGSNLSCTIFITFTPTVVGTRTGSVTVTDNNNGTAGSQQSIALTGIGIAPITSLSTTSLTFASQAVGTSSAAQNVTLSNIGNATLTISGIGPSGDYSETNNCGGSVASGGSCTIAITFTPSAAGTRTGTITISDNAAASPQYINLTGAGVGGSPIATLTTTSLTFGGQSVGTVSSAQTVTLSNTGMVSLTINGIAASGDYAQSNNCPASLATNAGCSISVTFTPTTTGTRTGAISIADNASNSPQSIGLTGIGLAPAVSLSATSLTFNNQQVGTVSAAQTVTLTNTGNASLSLASIAAAGDYGETNNCAASLGAGANCTISITFAPSALGLRIGSLTITDSASGSPQSIGLQGTGVAPFVSLSATSLSFGNQVINTTSAAQTVTLTNSGTGTLLNISVSAAGDFAQTNTCGSSLGAGLSCTLSLTYTPTVFGSESGSISITDSAAGSPQQILLSGTGVPAVAVSPSALSFTLQLVDTSSATQTITLTNYQTVALSVGSISISGPFTETDNCANTQVAAQGSCAINVAFVPTANGTGTGTLIVTENGPGGSATVQLAGTGSGIVPNGFVGVSSMGIPRAQHAAILLSNGDILITGGASTAAGQLFNPTTNGFTATANNMSSPRTWHMSRELNGTILVLGGVDANGNYLATADLYNVKTNKFTPTGNMSVARAMPTATTLKGGSQMLIAGGVSSSGPSGPQATAEIYSSKTGVFTLTGSMYTPRYNHAASGLPDGTILITGGRCDPSPSCAPDVGVSAEVYNPATGTFTRVGNMNVSRALHTSTVLLDGTVLITGGFIGTVDTAEIYNPTTQTFTPTATEMVGGSIEEHRATPLGTNQATTNQVLITGGNDSTEAQVYDVATQTFTAVGSMTTPRSFHTATPVATGVVLVTGGSNEPCEGVLRSCPQQWASAELFNLPSITATISPTALSFGGLAVGTTSSAQPVTINNTGNAVVSITSVAISGDFTIQTNTCPASLQPATTCALGIAFAPAALGSRIGTLTITDNLNGSPQSVALSGTGTTTTTTSLSSSLKTAGYGKPVTLTAAVVPAIAGTPSGSVTFYDGATALGSVPLNAGTAALTTSNLTGGAHSLTASYPGDGTFGASTSPILLETVTPAVASITLKSSLNPSDAGQPVTFSVVVSGSPAVPTGSVTFKKGSTVLGIVALSAGDAGLTTTFTTSGTDSITASYSGDQNYKAANSSALKQVVDEYSTNTVLSSGLNPSTYGLAVKLTASVSSSGSTPTGTVTFNQGSVKLGTAALSDGKAAITVSTLAAGTATLTASYGGDTAHAKSTSASLEQVVNQATSTTAIASSANPSKAGKTVKFTATVTSATTKPTGTVTFKDGNAILGTETLVSGKATFSTSALSTGSHNITAVYGGTANVTGSTSVILMQIVN